jgi:hypothetical protein
MEGGSMARMPGLLRSFVLFTVVACSGCASWHYRKDADKYKATVSTDGTLQPIAQNLANASLHGWNFNSRW